MTVVTAAIEADLATITEAVNVGARTVVALPPSDLDTPGLIRVRASGTEITRAYDPVLVQP